MHQKIISSKTKRLLAALAKGSVVRNFYLAGGTGLAMQIGHRKSIDLDWFNQKEFDSAGLRNELKKIGKITIESQDKDTLNLILAGIKLSFFRYPYGLLFPLIDWQGIGLADWRDIACMKLDVVSSRGSKKDFIDLYFILQKCSLAELLELFAKKYQDIKYNKIHLLKSLIYFADAEKEPMPVMIKNIDWSEVKLFLEKIVKNGLVKKGFLIC